MSNRKARRAIRAIAKQEGVSTKEVRREIRYAMGLAQQNTSSSAVSYWHQLACGGAEPTPEELIENLAKSLNKGRSEKVRKG